MELEQLRERFVTQLQQGEERLKELDGTIESQEKAIESFEKKIAVEEEELLAIDDGESSIAPGAVFILSDWLTPIFYVRHHAAQGRRERQEVRYQQHPRQSRHDIPPGSGAEQRRRHGHALPRVQG